MKKIKNAGIALIMITVTLFMTCCSLFVDPTADDPSTYVFPGETLHHEGTWITWPHNKSNKQKYYFGDVGIDGDVYVEMLEPVWIAMAKELHTGETVHIIAYDSDHQAHIASVLEENGVDLTKIDFVIIETDDVWLRDNGPLFTLKDGKELVIANFIFDGYGEGIIPEYYSKDAKIASSVASIKGYECIDLDMALEGGAIDMDGHGTLIAAKSSVVGSERNSGMTLRQAEQYLKKYFGVTNIIWIDGLKDQDITDGHIDACVRFADGNKIITLPHDDFMEYCTNTEKDWKIVTGAVNADGVPYEIVEIPLTETFFEELGNYGCYLNYYVGNEVVLVPTYGDVNDQIALDTIASLYPTRRVVGINCRDLAIFGGMLHCVTQQQPDLEALLNGK